MKTDPIHVYENAEIEWIARECAEKMINNVQSWIGVDDGGVAAMYFCEGGPEWHALQELLCGYIKTELIFKGTEK